MVVCTTELGSMLNTDQEFMFSSLFAKEATNVMLVVINFNSRSKTAQAVLWISLFTATPRRRRFYWQEDNISATIQMNVNEQLWTARWISRGINVILPLCDYMLDLLCMSIYVMRDETKERAAWGTNETQNLNPDCLKCVLQN